MQVSYENMLAVDGKCTDFGQGPLCQVDLGLRSLCCTFMHRAPEGWAAPNIVTYNSLLNSCATSSRWDVALELYLSLRSHNLVPTSVTYTALTSAVKARWDLGQILLTQMRSAHVQSTITWNSLIEALQDSQQWQSALGLFIDLPRSEVRPDSWSFGAAIRAAGTGENWQLALVLLTESLKAHAAVDSFACSAAIQACQHDAQWQMALELLSWATMQRVEADTVLCTAAMAVAAKAGRWQHALTLFQSMRAQDVRQSAVSYSTAISACARQGQWHLVLNLVEEMVENGCKSFSASKYDHTVQAGSSLDCFKHTVLISLLQTITAAADPIHFIDTHAGRGIYCLDACHGGHKQKHGSGIAKLMQLLDGSLPPDTPPAVREYLVAVRSQNKGKVLTSYPGSAVLALAWLRPQDTATLFEISDAMFSDLVQRVGDTSSFCGREALCADSYWWLLHNAVPTGQGLVIIDPPCDPYDLHMAWSLFTVRHLRRQQPQFCVVMWYPCLDALQTSNLYGQARSLNAGTVLVAEFEVADVRRDSLQSSGLLIFNAPPETAATLEELLQFLAGSLRPGASEVHAKVFQLFAEGSKKRIEKPRNGWTDSEAPNCGQNLLSSVQASEEEAEAQEE